VPAPATDDPRWLGWEKIMSKTNDTLYGTAARSQHELTADELNHVSGGTAPKQEAFPTETIKMTYGAIQWTYT
jgi:bacteriocin-like protein